MKNLKIYYFNKKKNIKFKNIQKKKKKKKNK